MAGSPQASGWTGGRSRRVATLGLVTDTTATDRPTTAWGHGLATIAADATTLDTWYPQTYLGTRPSDAAFPEELLAHVGDVDTHAIGNAVDVEQVAAVVGDERVDQQHVGAERDELARQVAADEPEAAGDHHGPAAVELQMFHGHDRGGAG